MSNDIKVTPTIQQIVDVVASMSIHGSPRRRISRQRPFGEAEKLLLDEAQERFEFEQKTAGALQSKSTLFLTLTGLFAALITTSIGRLFDRAPGSSLEVAALAIFVISLALMTVVGILLGRFTISRS
jgi:hypothetical protein